MEVVNKDGALWEYLTEEMRGLILDGEDLLTHAETARNKVSDYSYLVFPFAKSYEGFLKLFFLDLGLIQEDEYYGEEIRIGRILNPVLMKKKYSVYKKLSRHKSVGTEIARKLWVIWKRGRNQVFHYFPHNFRKLGKKEALDIVKEFVDSMDLAVAILNQM